ncbi:MAG: hypothetical protein QNL62_14060 [Gammaproteobacteria bacterium]|nr:hypothetical protein [Gammaproteobacteria bacterium]
MLKKKVWLLGGFAMLLTPLAYALDNIPEDISAWTEKGGVLSTAPSIAWEEQNQIAVIGVSNVNGTYYLFYLAGFDGCWNADGDANHQSVGLATSTDGINFTKHVSNPVLKPHDFLPVGSHEEGIRTGYVQYVPSKNKFYGYFGVESPGGQSSCDFGGGGALCECNVSVDSSVYLATSDDGINWTIDGAVSGTYAAPGNEVYASGWVHDGTNFGLYVTTAEGGSNKAASKGANPLSLNEFGGVPALSFGWSGVDAYLHDDNNTITLIYEPDGGIHPGANNDNLYFATTHLDDMLNVQNERVVSTSGDERNIIFRDGSEWKWYYSDEADEYNNVIKLRTYPIADLLPPKSPGNVTVSKP